MLRVFPDEPQQSLERHGFATAPAGNHGTRSDGSTLRGNLDTTNVEEFSMNFLSEHASHPGWGLIVSTTNEYRQTMAHIAVMLGYSRLLHRLIAWGIDLNVADVTGATALH